MSVSPTEDTLIVALDFEGEIECVSPAGSSSRSSQINEQQGPPVSRIRPRRKRFSCFSILLFQISCVNSLH